jgi:hypothetical protein
MPTFSAPMINLPTRSFPSGRILFGPRLCGVLSHSRFGRTDPCRTYERWIYAFLSAWSRDLGPPTLTIPTFGIQNGVFHGDEWTPVKPLVYVGIEA